MQRLSRFTHDRLPARGFTLIELMVVVTIVGVLASIGYPMYSEQVRKGHRASAQTHMLDLASRQGEILADSRSYAAKAELLTLLPTPLSVSKFYTIDVTVATTPPGYTIKAVPLAGTSQAADVELQLKSTGERLPAGKW